jgi:hypothetical protein
VTRPVAAILHVRSAARMRTPVALVLLLTHGCATTVHVQRPITADAVERIAPVLRGEDATIVYASPSRLEERHAARIFLTSHDVQWVRADCERVAAPLDAVRQISICESGCRQKGALIGMGVGVAVGTLVSALAVWTCNGSLELSDRCSVWWIAGPTLGFLLGALIGAHGTRTIVDLENGAAAK